MLGLMRKKWDRIESCWWRTTWRYASESQLTISHGIKYRRPCSNDVILTDIFTKYSINPKKMYHLQKCRVFLQAVALSEIFYDTSRHDLCLDLDIQKPFHQDEVQSSKEW